MAASDPPALRPITASDVRDATSTLAQAFDSDPMFRFLLPEATERAAWLPVIFGAMLAESMPDNHVFLIPGASPRGVLQLLPPGAYPAPKSRVLGWIMRPSLRSPIRLPSARFAKRGIPILRLMERLHIKERHYYVQVLGVHPSQQGMGIGGALLRHGLAAADREGLPAYLETTKESNVALYRRFGFEVLEEVSLPGGHPPLWAMRRPPHP